MQFKSDRYLIFENYIFRKVLNDKIKLQYKLFSHWHPVIRFCSGYFVI